MNHPVSFAVRPARHALLASLLAVAGLAAAADVGQVSLMIGGASVVRADGSRETLHRGSAIRVGDRVETAANGHVHMRFIDNGAISVRPDSVLEVQAYRYDVQRPELNEVRLRMDQGTSRSISGAATELDKSRFRLNTPIAAIGVRGTDFIVSSDAAGVRATVADGAIVVGALGGACQAAALGPCGGAETRLLSADMGRLMAEVRPGERGTRLVPVVDTLVAAVGGAQDRLGAERQSQMAAARSAGLLAAEPTSSEARRGNDRAAAELLTLSSSQLPDRLNRPLDVSGLTVAFPKLSDTPSPVPSGPGAQPAGVSNVPVSPTIDPVLTSSGQQLMWGRWAIRATEFDRVSVPFALAQLGRHITVADDAMGLFRANQTQAGEFFAQNTNAVVNFNLTRATTTYELDAKTELARIDRSSLQIDFGRRTFATGLDLSTASGVEDKLRMAGDIRSDGLFAVKDAGQRVAGAVSLDGKEAGYLFERSVSGGGIFRGRTLWGN